MPVDTEQAVGSTLIHPDLSLSAHNTLVFSTPSRLQPTLPVLTTRVSACFPGLLDLSRHHHQRPGRSVPAPHLAVL